MKNKKLKQQESIDEDPRSKVILMNVADTRYEVVRHVGKEILDWKLTLNNDEDWDILWTDNCVQPETLARMKSHQKINHWPGMYSLARKNHLAKNLMKMKKKFPCEYDFFPETWLLPSEANEFSKQINGKSIFIVKPEASCQGRGIFLIKDIEDIPSYGEHFVAQRYMKNPLIIDGLKFDMRLYVLLAGCDPLRIYLFKEGLARFATEKYVEPDEENMDDVCMHLTNYAINKGNPNFIFNQDDKCDDVGHKRSMTSVLKLLHDRGHPVDEMMEDIKKMLIKMFCSVQPTLSHAYKSCQPYNYENNMCFEILGIDIIIDENFKPWLLEVNHTPSFTTDTPLDRTIKKNVILDSLRLMNINYESRVKAKDRSYKDVERRTLEGRKCNLTPQEKAELKEKAQYERDDFEEENLGGFEKVYPLSQDHEDMFDHLIKFAERQYSEWTGTNIIRNTKRSSLERNSESTSMNNCKKNKIEELQRIYLGGSKGTKKKGKKPKLITNQTDYQNAVLEEIDANEKFDIPFEIEEDEDNFFPSKLANSRVQGKGKNISNEERVMSHWKSYGPLAIYESGDEDYDNTVTKNEERPIKGVQEQTSNSTTPLVLAPLKATEFRIRSNNKTTTSAAPRNHFASTLNRMTQLYSRDKNTQNNRSNISNTKKVISKDQTSTPISKDLPSLPKVINQPNSKVLRPRIIQFDMKGFSLTQEGNIDQKTQINSEGYTFQNVNNKRNPGSSIKR